MITISVIIGSTRDLALLCGAADSQSVPLAYARFKIVHLFQSQSPNLEGEECQETL
jgi:hypothetical protein